MEVAIEKFYKITVCVMKRVGSAIEEESQEVMNKMMYNII